MFAQYTDAILATKIDLPRPVLQGNSRGDKVIPAFQLGNGACKISLIGGCHADEPVGPRLLRKLVSFLSKISVNHPMLKQCSWWIVPHVNPDGEQINKSWYSDEDIVFNLAKYFKHVYRELPGDDLEFGFPIEGQIGALRPENQFVYDFWKSSSEPFHLHASLHGMGYSFGPWYLVESTWLDRIELLVQECVEATSALGYKLHDWQRNGEKGFHRIREGFCTRPDSQSMRQFFLDQNNFEMAAKFHPSSMESIRSLGGDCLTLVTEMPLFVLPNRPDELPAINQAFNNWRQQIYRWRTALLTKQITSEELLNTSNASGLKPMPIWDQMALQWRFICAGIATVSNANNPPHGH